MPTNNSETVDEPTVRFDTPQIDVANVRILSVREKMLVKEVAESFVEKVGHYFDQLYLHLYVEEFKERTRRTPAFHWRALLTTDNGRYYADDWSYGVEESLNKTFDALGSEIRSRMGKAEQARRGSTIGVST